ncbi:hypothetical protein TREPR_0845 [Treponema primitia ZAS-2]|uniref:Uncharacterized protein n=1 Tax=Treponema primitia (strain ATCC BAA-887 / DSM 12427 / ZAS-2) TaxID=545694 RepID=F5YIQ1_TREPZ|nr:hypothetical protein TREPR_0845 [Treponema primitia ZAS-2]
MQGHLSQVLSLQGASISSSPVVIFSVPTQDSMPGLFCQLLFTPYFIVDIFF